MASRFTEETFARADRVMLRAADKPLSVGEMVVVERWLTGRGILPAATATLAPAAPAPAAPAAAPAAAPGAPVIVASPIVRLAMSTVNPGDLITAGFMNNIVEALLALDRRLAALEGMTTAPPPPPTPQPTPPPPPEPDRRAAPTIETAIASRLRRGVEIDVVGINLGEGMVEQVLLGKAEIDVRKLEFTRTGFKFLTTLKDLTSSRQRLTVTTSGGNDSARITGPE